MQVPNYEYLTDQAFTVDCFSSVAECSALIEKTESIGFVDAPINTNLGPQIIKEIRDNTRVMIDDGELADELWLRVRDFVPKRIGEWAACGVNERFRFYRYEVDQQFDWHYDGYFERNSNERSHLTFMVYLNDVEAGGATNLEGLCVQPKVGKALVFAHRLLHKGEPVIEGRKYVLRTDIMYERFA